MMIYVRVVSYFRKYLFCVSDIKKKHYVALNVIMLLPVDCNNPLLSIVNISFLYANLHITKFVLSKQLECILKCTHLTNHTMCWYLSKHKRNKMNSSLKFITTTTNVKQP